MLSILCVEVCWRGNVLLQTTYYYGSGHLSLNSETSNFLFRIHSIFPKFAVLIYSSSQTIQIISKVNTSNVYFSGIWNSFSSVSEGCLKVVFFPAISSAVELGFSLQIHFDWCLPTQFFPLGSIPVLQHGSHSYHMMSSVYWWNNMTGSRKQR